MKRTKRLASPSVSGLWPGQWVMVVDKALEPLLQHVRIDLGGRDVGVAEKLLNGAQVGAAVEQVAGEGMAQNVRADTLVMDPGLMT